jgi:hypothetical protein
MTKQLLAREKVSACGGHNNGSSVGTHYSADLRTPQWH